MFWGGENKMSEGRKKFCGHLSAARNWLRKAEDSIAENDDLSGDLKLMLAQAELQHARETRKLTASQIWLRRLLPAAIALGLAACCLLYVHFHPDKGGYQGENPAAAAAEPRVQTEVQQDAAQPLPVQAEEAQPQPVTVAQPVQASVVRDTPAEAVREKPAAVQETKPSVPSEEMQKLMSSAGKTLRAQ